jgi:hypothetical protein
MKKLLALLLLTLSASAMAQQHGGHGGGGFGHRHGHAHNQGQWSKGYTAGWGWSVPAVIGGLMVYEAVRQPVYVQPNPVVIQQQPVYTPQANPTCTPWTEVQSSDGTISRTRTCTQ